MTEASSLRRSQRTRSLDGRPSPYVFDDDDDDDDEDEDDVDDDSNNKNVKTKTVKKQKDKSFQLEKSCRKRKNSFTEVSNPKKCKSTQSEHRQVILSNWYVEQYDNDEDSVFDVKECILCPRRFFTDFSLRKHFEKDHLSNDHYCRHCNIYFVKKEDFKHHLSQKHSERHLPSAMFWTPEVQDILHKLPTQEQNSVALPQPQQLNDQIQLEPQKQCLKSPIQKENFKPLSEAEQQKFKLPLLIQQQKYSSPFQAQKTAKTPLKTQQQNVEPNQNKFKTPPKSQQQKLKLGQNFQTFIFEQNFQIPLQTKQTLQTPPRTREQSSQTPSQTQLRTLKPPSPSRRRESFSDPNFCHICKKVFSYNGYLKIHIESVHKQQKQQCKICEKSYSGRSQLLRHIKSAHWGTRYECSYCGQTYSQKNTLRVHIMNVHKIES